MSTEREQMEKRRLLFCEFAYSGEKREYVEHLIRVAVNTMDELGALEHFRESPDKPYFTWCGEQEYGTATFKLRLKSPWHVETVFYHLNEIKCGHVNGLSWFPSRHDYGGIVCADGTIIETWDI